MSKTKVALLGTGFIANIHAESYARFVHDAEVVAVYGRDKAHAEAFAAAHGIPAAYGDIDELLAAEQVDVVDICLPNYLHHEACLKAAGANKHVIIEKPLALTLEQADEMIEACRSRGIAVTNVVGYSTHSVAQLTVATVLSLACHLRTYHAFVASGEYTASGIHNRLSPVYHELYGRTWGVLGYGHIGQQVARVAEAYAGYSRLRGIQDAAFVDDFREMHGDLSAYPDFLFTFGSALRETGRYNESNAVLREGTEVSCDPMFYTVMGNNYRDLGAAEEAEEAYRKAAGMVPGRLYPLYRLMKLYEAEGRQKETHEMARRIADARPKVESPATRQMKNEAKALIERDRNADHER